MTVKDSIVIINFIDEKLKELESESSKFETEYDKIFDIRGKIYEAYNDISESAIVLKALSMYQNDIQKEIGILEKTIEKVNILRDNVLNLNGVDK